MSKWHKTETLHIITFKVTSTFTQGSCTVHVLHLLLCKCCCNNKMWLIFEFCTCPIVFLIQQLQYTSPHGSFTMTAASPWTLKMTNVNLMKEFNTLMEIRSYFVIII